MTHLRWSLREDRLRLVWGFLGVIVVTVLMHVFARDRSTLPISALLLPVMGMALISGSVATGLIGVTAVAIGTLEYAWGDYDSPDQRVRYATLVLGSIIATALAGARARRERALAEHRVEIDRARVRLEAEQLVSTMLESLPRLSAAADIPTAAAQACSLAREVFGSDAASYWQVDGDDCVLLARDPMGEPPLGTRLPRARVAARDLTLEQSRTAWVRRSDVLKADDGVGWSSDAVVGTSTPIRVAGTTAAYLALNWDHHRATPDPTWLDALDRFVDQVALAKTVIRRRNAQTEASQLARRLQAGLMPSALPKAGPVGVRTLYRPGMRQLLLGGDFLDVWSSGGSLSFILGDVSGHGPEQAALGAMLRAAWMGIVALPDVSLLEWGRGVDRVLCERRPSDEMFVTAVMGRIDPTERILRYVSAGHPPPVLLTPEVRVMEFSGPPLGVVPDPHLVEHVVALPVDWSVLLVTDGFFEGRDAPGSTQRVGFDDFVAIVAARREKPLDEPEFLTHLADEMEGRNGGPLSDDAAAMLLTARTDPPPSHDGTVIQLVGRGHLEA